MSELNLVEKVIALESVELMNRLSPDQLASLATIATEVRFAPGRAILEGHRPVDALYVVVDGQVELKQSGEPLDTVGPAAVLGMWALFDDGELTALSATAREDTRLLRISRDEFYDLLADNSDITSAMFSTLFSRFKKLVTQ